MSLVTRFNPRTREGANSHDAMRKHLQSCFNPRTREGANYTDAQLSKVILVSIHAPVKVRTGYGYHGRGRA